MTRYCGENKKSKNVTINHVGDIQASNIEFNPWNRTRAKDNGGVECKPMYYYVVLSE